VAGSSKVTTGGSVLKGGGAGERKVMADHVMAERKSGKSSVAGSDLNTALRPERSGAPLTAPSLDMSHIERRTTAATASAIPNALVTVRGSPSRKMLRNVASESPNLDIGITTLPWPCWRP